MSTTGILPAAGPGWSSLPLSGLYPSLLARVVDLARGGATLGRLDLAHDGQSGAGGLTIDAPSIVFAEGGLQPADLSPLAGDFVGSPATGSVAFEGRVDWLAEAEGSGFDLVIVENANAPEIPLGGTLELLG